MVEITLINRICKVIIVIMFTGMSHQNPHQIYQLTFDMQNLLRQMMQETLHEDSDLTLASLLNAMGKEGIMVVVNYC